MREVELEKGELLFKSFIGEFISLLVLILRLLLLLLLLFLERPFLPFRAVLSFYPGSISSTTSTLER